MRNAKIECRKCTKYIKAYNKLLRFAKYIASLHCRFNLAPTFGYSYDVGKKTNVTTLNPEIVAKK